MENRKTFMKIAQSKNGKAKLEVLADLAAAAVVSSQ